jgi:ribonuclease HI
MKYYAVKKGKNTGIFYTWEECKKAIDGFSGSEYSSFSSEEEAQAYFNGLDFYDQKIKQDIKEGFVVAFTDGSYDKDKNLYSYGVVAIDCDLKETELYSYGNNEKYVSSKNIAGEVFGVLSAIDWAVSNEYKKIKIYHDYNGISEWFYGNWDTNSEIAKFFNYIINNRYTDMIEIKFERIPGHTNIKYNDRADRLAAKALNKQQKLRLTNKSWFKVDDIKTKDLDTIINLIRKEYEELQININEDSDLKKCLKLILGKNKLTVTFFKTKDKIIIQGKQSILFQEFASYILNFVTNIEPIFQNIYKININKDVVIEELNKYFPSFPNKYPDIIKKWLKQAIINLGYNVSNCEDYTQYTVPALKALDSHIEFLFINNGIAFREKYMEQKKEKGNIGRFYMFDKIDNGKYKLSKAFSDEIKDKIVIENLEKCYNYYNKHRHTLFHTGFILGETTTARILEKKKDADEIIKECLNLIKETI